MQAMLVHGKYDFQKTKQSHTSSDQKEIVVDKLYTDSKSVCLNEIKSNGSLDMSWQLPENPAWQSALSESDCAFWEIVINVKQDGPDYEDCFLLPIY